MRLFPTARDDRGSIAISMMVMTAGVGLSAVIAMSSMQIITSARAEQFRAYALQAARAGLTSALTALRSALDTEFQGSVTKLPCGTYQPMSTDINPVITGTIGPSSTGAPSYQASIRYLTQDPTGQSDAWISQNGSPCITSTASFLPNFAYLSSVGTYGSDPARRATRTMFGIYAFRTALNANTGGGQIRSSAGTNLCLDAGGMTAGTRLTLQTCAATVIPQQKFAYQPGLEMTVGTGTSQLCVNTPAAAGSPVTLETCATKAAAAAPQRWSYNAATAFVATIGATSYCWNRASNTATAQVLSNTSTTTCATAASSGWALDPNVGAGGAGRLIPKSQLPAGIPAGVELHVSQLVNYNDSSQCLAYTSATTTVKITQCKQTLTFDLNTNFDQSWASPKDGDSGPIFAYDKTNGSGVVVCLTQPSVAALPGAVTITPCTINPLTSSRPASAANQTWWSRGVSTTAANLRYRFEGIGGWAGQCLASIAGSPVMTTCNITPAQKWNASAASIPAGLTSIGEK
jgi:hypothetical protein